MGDGKGFSDPGDARHLVEELACRQDCLLARFFSFLLSVPVSLASFVYFVVFGDIAANVGMDLLAIAAFSAFVFGYLSMSVLVKIARNANFSGFCMFFGSLAVFLALFLWVY